MYGNELKMTSNHKLDHYLEWRTNRIVKLEQIFGSNFFRGKTVLEVGAGTGLVGKVLRDDFGADVTFTEGRPELLKIIKENNPTARVEMINHECVWDLNERFDVIIHWGLLYHLDHWRQDLECTIKHLDLGGILSLESEVMDSDKEQELKIIEMKSQDDQSLFGVGTRPSSITIEKQLKALNLEFNRYDDADLNTSFHHYDWISENSLKYQNGQRRFWIAS